jgi:hypothetical protein
VSAGPGAAPRARLGPGWIRLAIALLFFTAAPTAGDIGSSCQPEDELDPVRFWGVKQAIDCQLCDECQVATKACSRACSKTLIFDDFPSSCRPVEHDGEVCLDALLAASCAEYAEFMADEGSTIPTECAFCREVTASSLSSGDAGDE